MRPITIVIGKNSSGKSALSRLPLLLANSFAMESDEPISINHNGVEFGGSFKDLIHNKYPHGSLKMTLNFVSDIVLSFEVQNISNTPIQLIKNWSITSPGLSLNLEIELTKENTFKTVDIKYFQGSEIYYVTFLGLIPISVKDSQGSILFKNEFDQLANELVQFSKSIEYIGPFRQIPDRVYLNSGKNPNKLGVKGENAPIILGTSSYRDETLLKNVGDWYEKFLGGWRVDVAQNLDTFEIVLVSPDDPTVKVNIVDVGQGMSQVLPLVVRCQLKSKLGGSINIIEQPELHLHPAAHGELAEIFAITAKRESSIFILETHSENIILRIRRLVVEGVLDESDVIIYWVDDEVRPGSVLKEIFIDQNGDLSDWPKGVFSEDFEEVLAIRQAQLKKEKNVG